MRRALFSLDVQIDSWERASVMEEPRMDACGHRGNVERAIFLVQVKRESAKNAQST